MKQGSMRLITFILWSRLIIQVQMTRDSHVWQFLARQDCCLQRAVAAPRPRPERELAEAAGGTGGGGHRNNAVVLLLPLLFSFTAILSTHFHLWFKLHGHTVGGSDETCMGFSLCLSQHWGVGRIFFLFVCLCCDQGFSKNFFEFFFFWHKEQLDFPELQNTQKNCVFKIKYFCCISLTFWVQVTSIWNATIAWWALAFAKLLAS